MGSHGDPQSGPFTLQPRITCDYSNLGLGRRVQSLCSPSNMESIKAVFFKPDPQAQVRKCNQLIRQNTRKLDRDIANMKLAENKAKTLIIQANRRAQRNPSQAKQADKVLGEILTDKMSKVGATPNLPTPVKDQPVAEDEDEEDAEAMLDQMRGRLEALKS